MWFWTEHFEFFPEELQWGLRLFSERMVGNTNLEKLTLVDLLLDEETARSLAQGIVQSQLKRLEIAKLHVTEHLPTSRRHVWQILGEGIGKSNSLQEVKMWGMNQYGPMVSEILINTRSIKTLHVRGCPEAPYDEADIGLIAQALARSNWTILDLEIAVCKIDDHGVDLLVGSLHPNLPIQRLSLRSNNVGPAGVRTLLRAMSHVPTLLKLELWGNQTIGFEGLRVLGEELKLQGGRQHDSFYNNRMIHMDVSGCVDFVVEEFNLMAQLPKSNCQQASQSLLDGITSNVHVQKLDIVGNGLPADTMNEILFYTQLNNMGRKLLVSDCGVASTMWCDILERCQEDSTYGTSLVYFFVREQPHLVQAATTSDS